MARGGFLMQTIFPILRYEDARAAIDWLCKAFGFRVKFSVPESGPFVRHAQLALGDNLVMIGSCRGDGIESPKRLGAATQAICAYVPDVDAHYEKARAAGAEITAPPTQTDFGAKEYHAKDLEGHSWTFGSWRPDAPSR
jgi:uncharacterized glyoxalase superfamily protein PhnB